MPQSQKTQDVLRRLRGGLVVSCQAHEPDGLYGVDRMTDMAVAAEMGGASGLRADDPLHVRSIRKATKLPIIGIYKEDYPGFATRITLNMDRAREIYEAGADIIAIEATDRPHPYNTTGFELIAKVKATWDVVVMADCSTIAEARLARAAGADILGTTMSGYTPYSPQQSTPDFCMIRQMKTEFPDAFVVCEGRVNSPEFARQCLQLGADAVCVGSNITRPKYITERYVAKMSLSPRGQYVLAFDIGGTKIAAALVTPAGEVTNVLSVPTPSASAEAVLSALLGLGDRLRAETKIPVALVGVSSGGTINSQGEVVYATDTLPGWKGFPLKRRVAEHFGLPTFVVNDGNAAALGEAIFGKGRLCRSVLAVTVGTGFGAGLVIDGEVHHATLDYAINMGALIAQRDGRVSDKVAGALEAYASGRSILDQYKQLVPDTTLTTGEEVGQRAQQGDACAVAAVRSVAEWCGVGLATIVACHNPEIVVVGGGVANLGDLFLAPLRETFQKCAFPPLKATPIELAALKSNANLAGAAVFANTMSH